jgi:hypothetical protein
MLLILRVDDNNLVFAKSLSINTWQVSYLRKTPPNKEALRHSGGASLRCTSATVTLYLEVELSKESLPGTEQNTSDGTKPNIMLSWWVLWWSRAADLMPEKWPNYYLTPFKVPEKDFCEHACVIGHPVLVSRNKLKNGYWPNSFLMGKWTSEWGNPAAAAVVVVTSPSALVWKK